MDGLNWWGDEPAGEAQTDTDRDVPVVALGTALQRTIKTPISCTGVGVHSGRPATLTLHPAAPDTGLIFRRVDLDAETDRDIPVTVERVVDGRLCTTLANDAGARVSTVEHLMAALAALGIDNLVMDIDGPEIPIMDGSAAPFLFLLECAGQTVQPAPRRALRVLKPVHINDGPVSASLMPAERGLSISFDIDFKARAIGRQSCRFSLSESVFRRHLARARTFGLREEVERMHAAGLGLGGSLENAVVVDDDVILNEDGLRYEEEFVRHKALDAIGDLYMSGRPLIGRYHGVRSSHAHNNILMRALLADPTAWRLETVSEDQLGQAAPDAFQARHEALAPTRACA
ncbi:UDP-3-O-acyl-N-acetylglucosamine deacetylase [Pararhodospirillum oryzae]|uniref:UDP-3-O-acyl-N-acetylglucosamine deacetylase n=1 Tax=Pararhodospirillum oryzae TaxID=478448 RepID=A0A512H8Q5_9PROT|nr:UDP-3-O-acyl-N-acetylglucosamine deacetylase [Pararhodospirillum oryzae]GEO81831.1 UDP-3-O-acyl-N-acetylglucosamine deacetylase [Pararhodospirillum oryzae]